METYLVKEPAGVGRRSWSQYLVIETMPREGRKVLKTGRDEAVVCAAQIRLARECLSQKRMWDSSCSDSLMLEVPRCLKYCVLPYGCPYFLTDYNLLLAVQTLEIGWISCGISLFGQHKQSVSPAVQWRKTWIIPVCPMHWLIRCFREGREKIGFVSQHVIQSLQKRESDSQHFSVTFGRSGGYTGNKPCKTKPEGKKKPHCYFCVNVYRYVFAHVVLKQKISGENLKFIACLAKRRKSVSLQWASMRGHQLYSEE